jgi:hypothetical protein
MSFTDYTLRRDTPVLAQSSYGVEKQIMELYVYDYGRKGSLILVVVPSQLNYISGYLDSRTVRLPTVAVRPGAVSKQDTWG